MREILFRGKNVDNNEWVYGSLCIDAVEQLRGVDAGANAFIRFYDTETKKMKMVEVQRETVGQYTGLVDKNGKKIFEGDTFIYHDFGGDYYKCNWYYGINSFSIDGIDDEDINDTIWFNDKKKEFYFDGVIIGNIHDKEEQ